jgi:threonine aldolase
MTRLAKDFGSDNHSGAHPEVLEAISNANGGHAVSYGEDDWTARSEAIFREHFGRETQAWCVLTGGGANVSALGAITRPFEAVVCGDISHVFHDECGALERMTGTKLLPQPTREGKLIPEDVSRLLWRRGEVHAAQPRVVSITQSSERGTVYTPEETRAIADVAHDADMLVHLDGARLANAAATLELPLKSLTTDAGVDVVSFGGTKNGLLLGEAVVFCNPELGATFSYTRKQLGQLASKQRFIAAQFEALLSGDLWLRSARHANAMSTRLAAAVGPLQGLEILHPVQANVVYARLPLPALDRLVANMPYEHYFHVWDANTGEVRWMCSWDTTEEDVDAFAATVERAVEAG